ncbi:putative ribonuclease H-like domain-containing protein, partial [Tanacetum coccineum]
TSRYVNTAMRHYDTKRHRAGNTARSYTGPVNDVRAKRGKPLMDDKGFVDSGCSRHMTGNIAYLLDFKEFDWGRSTWLNPQALLKLYLIHLGWKQCRKNFCNSNSNSQDKYVDEILKKFNYTDVKSASTPVDLEKPLVKDGDANDVDVHLYRSMIGSLMYLISSRPDIMFAASQKEVRTLRYLSLVVPLKKVGDEAVHKELGDRMERAATIASSLEVEQESVTAAELLTTVRHHLVLPVQVNAAEGGTDCLPTATIFEELARIGYEKPSQRLTFYKAFL